MVSRLCDRQSSQVFIIMSSNMSAGGGGGTTSNNNSDSKKGGMRRPASVPKLRSVALCLNGATTTTDRHGGDDDDAAGATPVNVTPFYELASAPGQAQVIVDQVADYFASGKLNHLLKPNVVALDVGANIGSFALELMRRTGGHAQAIYCFEPVDRTRHALMENVKRTLDPATPLRAAGTIVRVQDYGLGRETGTITFDVRPHAPACSGAEGLAASAMNRDAQVARIVDKMRDPENDDMWAKGKPRVASAVRALVPTFMLKAGVRLWVDYYNKVEKEEVKLDTIANFMQREHLDHVDLLKVDVEGAEEDVLMGMADGLDLESPGGIAELKERWSRVGAIVMELHDVDGRLHRVRHLLESVGGFRVDLEQEEVFKGGDAQGVDVWNVLATRED